MRARDKLEVVSNIREQGLDMTKIMIAPLVSQVEKYANQRKLEANDNPPANAVSHFIVNGNKQPVAVLNDGRSIKILPATYRAESLYNFLPARYKTLVI